MEDGKFTMYAGKSVALAEVFKFTIGKEPFVGPTVCRLELSAPTEESTDGGRLAVQHVSIVPEGGGPSTVIATAYQVEQRAEGRQYEVVAETYKKRFRASTFPVSPGQYDEMTRKLKDFFKQFGFKFEIPSLQAMPRSSTPIASPVATRPTAGGGATARATAGAAPVAAARRPTAPGGSARTASRQSVAPPAEDATPAGGSRTWIIVAILAVTIAGAAGAAVYFLKG
jgi:hypothetical protein